MTTVEVGLDWEQCISQLERAGRVSPAPYDPMPSTPTTSTWPSEFSQSISRPQPASVVAKV